MADSAVELEKILAEVDDFVVRYEKTFDKAVPFRVLSQQFGKRAKKHGFVLRRELWESKRFLLSINEKGATLVGSMSVK